jgi:F0F1-type ATP synthase assembly protein I
MKTLALTLLVGLAGYLAGLILGMVFINLLSTNQHDKSTEAAMTSAFVIGPALALLSMVVFLIVRLGR